MKERPILFSGPMVRALLDGSKTQTRRVIASRKRAAPYFVVYSSSDGSQPRPVYSADGERGHYIDAQGYDTEERMQCPYGHTGDRLWVRESFWGCDLPGYGDQPCVVYEDEWHGKEYRPAEPRPWARKFGHIPGIHMPRDSSRINLEVTGVRVERLQSISEADAIAEGIVRAPYGWWSGKEGASSPTVQGAYALLWESINGPGSWDANPWVWVIEFKREANHG